LLIDQIDEDGLEGLRRDC